MKRQEHKSAKGCCICRCKSSTSRFAKSDIWEKFFGKCFLLREGERKGDMCNACVLVVKRFSREAKESSYDWVVDSRRGPGSKNMMKIKKLRKMQRENENPLEKLLAELPVKKKAPRKQSKSQIRKRDSLPQTSILLDDGDNSTLRSQEELDEMWNKSFRRELPVPSQYGEDLTGYEMCCGIMLYSSKSQTAFCLKKSYKICPMHLQLSREKLLHSKNSSTVTSTYSEVSEDSCDALSRGSPETLSLMESLSNIC